MWDDIRAMLALAGVTILMCAAIHMTRPEAVCFADGGFAYGSYVDQARCAK